MSRKSSCLPDVSVLKFTITALTELTSGFGLKSGGEQVNVNSHALFYKNYAGHNVVVVFFTYQYDASIHSFGVWGCVCLTMREKASYTGLSVFFFKCLFVLLLLLTV